jgi:hypothetical protein
MKDVSEDHVDLFVALIANVAKNSFVKTEFARLDAVRITLVQKICHVSTNNVRILAPCQVNVVLVLSVMSLTTEFNVVVLKECKEILLLVAHRLLNHATATANVMNPNAIVSTSVKLQAIALVVKFVNVELVAQNVIQELVHQANFAKEMFALKDVVLTQIAQTICHASKGNAKILALKTNVEKRLFAARLIIVLSVFALMVSRVNQLLNVLKSNVNLMTIATWTKNAFPDRARIPVLNVASVESMPNVVLRTVKLPACVFLVSTVIPK